MATYDFLTANTNSTPLVTSGTVFFPYPSGRKYSDYKQGGEILDVQNRQVYYAIDDGFAVSYGATGITLTWNASLTIPAQTALKLQCEYNPALGSVAWSPPASRMAIYGDSRSVSSHNATGIRTQAQGFLGWVAALTRNRVVVPFSLNFGVSGETSAQIYARASTVAASNADIVVMLSGTNDSTLSYPASVQYIEKAVNVLLNAGKLVFLIAEIPRGNANGAGFSTGNRIKQHMAVHRYMLEMQKPGLIVIDAWPDMIDQANAVRPDYALDTMLYDGLHTSVLGAYTVANKIAAAVNTLYPEAPALVASNYAEYDATYCPFGNMVTNPLMTGTAGTTAGTGTNSGSVADNWVGNATLNMTNVWSKVSSGGKTWQQCVQSGTPTNANQQSTLSQSIAVANFSVGDVVEAICEFEVDAGGANFYGPSLEFINTGGTTGSAALYQDPSLGYGPRPAVAHSGVLRTPPYTIATGLSALSLQAIVKGKNGDALSATWRVRGFTVRKVQQ